MAKASRFTNGIVVRAGRPNAAGSPTGETKIDSIRYYTFTFDPASVAATTTAEQTVTVTGLLASDVVLCVNKPTHTTNFGVVNARVSAANTLALTLINPNASAADPGSETWGVVVMTATANA